jgi:hypothetical protein
MNDIFIPGNVPSSKNSKQMIFKGKGSPLLLWSKTAQKYVKDTQYYWIDNSNVFEQEYFWKTEGKIPLKVSFKFIRGSRHKFDYVNPLQTVLDLMVRYKWIPDDNADIILPVFEPYSYDKDNPGVIIKIL